MSNRNRKRALALITAVGLAFPVAASAAAPSQINVESTKVSYADLDIHSTAGARVLYSRLKRASEAVCGIQSHVINGSLADTLKARACFRETLETSVKKIESDALSEIHAS